MPPKPKTCFVFVSGVGSYVPYHVEGEKSKRLKERNPPSFQKLLVGWDFLTREVIADLILTF